MKPPFLDIIPHRFRRRSLGVTLSVFTRALLNFAGLAVLIPVLVIILDTEGIRSNPPREPKPPPAEARYCGCVPQAPTRRICNTANLRGAIHGK